MGRGQWHTLLEPGYDRAAGALESPLPDAWV